MIAVVKSSVKSILTKEVFDFTDVYEGSMEEIGKTVGGYFDGNIKTLNVEIYQTPVVNLKEGESLNGPSR